MRPDAEEPMVRRTQTALGEVIRFRRPPPKQGRAPEFGDRHPGVEWMRAMADQVLAGAGAGGRFRVDGRWTNRRPAAADGFGATEPPQEA